MKELTGPNQLMLLLTFIAIDLALNWLWITEKKKSPNHLLNWIVRAVVGAAIVYNGDTLTWFWRCVNLIPIYWFIFDYGLNLLRDKDLIYLGEVDPRPFWQLVRENFPSGSISLLDQIQLRSLGAYPWFIFKGIVALFCIVNMIYDYNPYSSPF